MSTKIPSEILASAFSRLYHQKMTTSSGGNISMKDEQGRIWVSPSALDKGFLKARDFIAICEDGSCPGKQKVSMETPFHLALYQAYPDIEAICHIHPINLVALSLLNEIDRNSLLAKFNLGFAEYAIPGSDALGEEIVKAFKLRPKAVLMQNHGIIAIGNSIDDLGNFLTDLNQEIGTHFGIENKPFDCKKMVKEESISFYFERIKSFIKPEGKLRFTNEKSTFKYQLKLKLSSFSKLQSLKIDFNSIIIPESYIILRDWVKVEQDYDVNSHQQYCSQLSENTPLMIFNGGDVLIGGSSYYQIYDRLEVFDFTVKVLLNSREMGSVNLLNEDQIEALRLKFF